MLATIDRDLIVSVGHGNVEIGTIPAGVGLERLRWSGDGIIDLAGLSEMHVCLVGGFFELHAIPVPGSQPVSMAWADRKNLVAQDGVIRVKTADELLAQKNEEYNSQLKTELRRNLCREIGDTGDQIADITKIICLMAAALCGDSAAMSALQESLPALMDTYDMDLVKQRLDKIAAVLNVLVKDYYAKKL